MSRKAIMVLAGAVMLVLAGCDTTQRDWEAARALNTVAAYEDFKAKHPRSRYEGEADAALERLDWDQAAALDTIESYGAYLEKYHGGPRRAEADARIEELEWERAAALNAVAAFKSYLEKYPEGRHALEARERVEWDAALKVYTLEGFQSFLQDFPASAEAKTAREKITELALLQAFILFEAEKKFPRLSKPIRELWKDYASPRPLAAFDPADQLGLLDLLVKIIIVKRESDFSVLEVSPFPIVDNIQVIEASNDEMILTAFPDGVGKKGGLTIEALGPVAGKDGDRYKISTKLPWEKLSFPFKDKDGTFTPRLPMGAGSIYRVLGEVKGLFTEIEPRAAKVVFKGDKDDPLYFMVLDRFGFTYLAGKGVAVLPDGTGVKLPVE